MPPAISTPAVPPRAKLGVSAPLSGRGAVLGREMAQAVRLAVEEANAAGSSVELEERDDRGEEQAGVAAALAFAADRAVVAVIGPYNSNVALAAASFYRDARLALVGPIVSNPVLTESGWDTVFRFTNRDDDTAAAIAFHLVRALGKRRAALVATSTAYGRSMTGRFADAFARAGGAVLARHEVAEGETRFDALIGSLPAEMDVLFYGGTYEGAPLLSALRRRGLTQLFAAGDGCWDRPNFLDPAGGAAEEGEGVLILSACPEPGVVPGAAEAAARYERRFGPVLNYAVNTYDATALTLAALRDAIAARGTSPGRAAVLDALRRAEWRGVAYPDPVRWDGRGDNGAAVTALHVVRGGRFVQVALVPRGL
jgi:branched-chain amino acid transport system substrate-binding protein